MRKYTILFGAICAVILAFSQNAKADFVSTLNVGNDALNGFSGPFGTVDVSLSGQIATITFTAGAGYVFLDGSSAAVQVNASSFTSAIVNDSEFKQFSSGQVDGFGTFNLTIDNNDGFGSPVSLISFSVTNTSGTPWASAADVLGFSGPPVGNAGGPFDAAAHVAPLSAEGSVTGFAGEGPGGHVPDAGATATLLGLGLAGMAGIRARFGRN
jgi:hypothetical protein